MKIYTYTEEKPFRTIFPHLKVEFFIFLIHVNLNILVGSYLSGKEKLKKHNFSNFTEIRNFTILCTHAQITETHTYICTYSGNKPRGDRSFITQGLKYKTTQEI